MDYVDQCPLAVESLALTGEGKFVSAFNQNETSTQCVVSNDPSAINNGLEIFAAVFLAMKAPNPNCRSPAYAVQQAFAATRLPDESVATWVPRLLSMSGLEYEVGWEGQANEWTSNGERELIDGLLIAKDCVYWMQRGWDFTFHDLDDRFEYEDCDSRDRYQKAMQELAASDLSGFMLPGAGEMVRRVWRNAASDGRLRMLDIWESPLRHRYYYAIREEGSPELLTRCSVPVYAHTLKLLVETELAPACASEPFIVKARNRQKV